MPLPAIHIRLSLALILPLAMVACRPDDPVEPTPPPPPTTGTLKVVIRPTWNGAPFEMYETYHNVSDYRVKVELLKFYLGNVRLVNDDASTTVKDVELFDLRFNGDTVLWSGVQPGTWDRLSFGLGVPQALNDALASTYPRGHALSLDHGTYWSWGAGYRFVMFDGKYDTDGAGTGPVLQPFSMHTGFNICYRELDLPLAAPLDITVGNTSTLVLELAVDRFFHSDTDTLDLQTEHASHGSDPTHALALKLTNNVVHSFTVQ
ncbi:MAG: hypothetical protein KF797_07730 [Flavobacteriales bacterium]|nr:hypothetical protein [Flavobacteriales bacterium]